MDIFFRKEPSYHDELYWFQAVFHKIILNEQNAFQGTKINVHSSGRIACILDITYSSLAILICTTDENYAYKVTPSYFPPLQKHNSKLYRATTLIFLCISLFSTFQSPTLTYPSIICLQAVPKILLKFRFYQVNYEISWKVWENFPHRNLLNSTNDVLKNLV